MGRKDSNHDLGEPGGRSPPTEKHSMHAATHAVDPQLVELLI